MSGGYERVRSSPGCHQNTFNSQISNNAQVNAHDEDEPETPISALPRQLHPIPNSPPPSFHSRRSSRERNLRVDPDLADAFESDGDESDDEADDRQRLVRGSSSPVTGGVAGQSSLGQSQTTAQSSQPQTTPSHPGIASRIRGVFGGGIQSDGVFSNLTAKPERGGAAEKEELPPVCYIYPCSVGIARY